MKKISKLLGIVGMVVFSVPVFADLEPQVMEGSSLEAPETLCPTKLTQYYSWYAGFGVDASFLRIPKINYGINPYISDKATLIQPRYVYTLGKRSRSNWFIPAWFGREARYEVSFAYTPDLDENKASSSKVTSMTALAIDGTGGEQTVNFANPTAIELKTKAKVQELSFLVKSDNQNIRPYMGVEFMNLEETYKVGKLTDTSGNPFSLKEKAKAKYVGPIGGVDLMVSYGDHAFNFGGDVAAHYAKLDLDATQQLNGSTYKASPSRTAFNGKVGLHTGWRYFFDYGSIGVKLGAYNMTSMLTVKNPNRIERKARIEYHNKIHMLGGLRITLHPRTYVVKPVGRCVGI